MMTNKGIPCCAVDAMRRAKYVEVNGATVGLSMLELVFAEVQELDHAEDAAVRAEFLRHVKVYTCVPLPAEDACAHAVHRDYANGNDEGGRR